MYNIKYVLITKRLPPSLSAKIRQAPTSHKKKVTILAVLADGCVGAIYDEGASRSVGFLSILLLKYYDCTVRVPLNLLVSNIIVMHTSSCIDHVYMNEPIETDSYNTVHTIIITLKKRSG
jgi:hypothetical protein